MSESEKQLTTWEEVIVDFFENRVSESELYKAREYVQKKDTEIQKERDPRRLARLNNARDKKSQELVTLRMEKNGISEWFDKTSKKTLMNGKKLIKATHVLKFAHSSAPPEGLLLKEKHNEPLLTTGSFKKPVSYDIAHSNGNLITISRFFALSLDKNNIIDLVLDNDFSFLDRFSKETQQRKQWEEGLSRLVEEREIKNGKGTKQVFFPKIANSRNYKEDYDLLIPLFSSSLCEQIYSWINHIKYGEEQKKARNKTGPIINKSTLILYSTGILDSYK